MGGSVTFQYGGNHPDFANVIASIGTKFVTSVPDAILQVTDLADSGNGLPGARVELVVAPDPNYWTGTGGATWDQNTTINFTTNNEADALTEGTFDTANAISGRVTFADEYFDTGAPVAASNTSITIAAGGVAADFVDFLNSGLSYTVTSSDALGISAATAVSFNGGGTTTLSGTHAYAGGTKVGAGSTLILDAATTDLVLPNSSITNAGTVVIDNAAAATQNGSLVTGAGTLQKNGAGDLTLTTGNGGTLDITAGQVSIVETYSMNNVNIASSATFDMTRASGTFNAPNTTFTGGGTLVKRGAGQIRWANQVLNMELGSDALIHVVEGVLRGGSNANDVWTSNLSDLTVDSGATFLTSEANAYVDAVNGGGTIRSGFLGTSPLPVPYEALYIGVDDGGGTFTGVIENNGVHVCSVVKKGSGTQIFDGANTYTGDTTVEEGVLTLDYNSIHRFVPAANGVTNQIKGGGVGTGTVNLGGVIEIDLSAAAAAPANSWVLVDQTNLDAVFVPGLDGVLITTDSTDISGVSDFNEQGDGTTWTLDDGAAIWTFDETTGMLSYGVGADSKFWTGLGGSTWDAATTANFSNNIPADAVDNVTFEEATATTMRAGFADVYFNSGESIPATNTSITIAAGGVSTDNIDFFNNSLAYSVASSDAFGISGTTNINVNGTAAVTLIGEHATTGTTTLATGTTLTYEAAAPATFASVITGGGSLVKTGGDALTISATNTYTGATTISAGTLKATANSSTTAVTIASGATFELDYNNRWGAVTTYSGDGTLAKTGTAAANFFKGTFALGTDALIDVQEGTLVGSTGGSGGSEIWTDNMSDMIIAGGASFNGSEGNIRIDALDGAGTFSTGFNGAGYVNTTIGVADGDGTFSGTIQDNDTAQGHIGFIVKIGAGTQVFSGDSTIGGNIQVQDGVLTLAEGGSVTFFPAANGVNNQINGGGAGTGTINANGALNLDLTGADTTPANSWLLVDATNVVVVPGETLTVTSTEGVFTDNMNGTYELDTGGNLWTVTLDEAGATLTVAEGTAGGPTDEEISSDEFVSNYSFDGTNANFSFQGFDGTTYEIRRTDDLTVPLASWTTVYGPTVQLGDGTIMPIMPLNAPGVLTEAFYVLIITPAP